MDSRHLEAAPADASEDEAPLRKNEALVQAAVHECGDPAKLTFSAPVLRHFEEAVDLLVSKLRICGLIILEDLVDPAAVAAVQRWNSNRSELAFPSSARGQGLLGST